jgi:hypothetical protein
MGQGRPFEPPPFHIASHECLECLISIYFVIPEGVVEPHAIQLRSVLQEQVLFPHHDVLVNDVFLMEALPY